MEEPPMKFKRRRSPGKPRVSPTLIEHINPNVAGIDCGSAEHYVAVPPDRDPTPVQAFSTFTSDLIRLADWLTACRVTSVAMEATGVYWIPLYEILEARGFEVLLVNARHFKNVSGRKSDVSDCEWLRELHSVGLLRGSFRPTAGIVALRTYLRHRQTLVETASTYTLRMQKALVQMNLQLPLVVSDTTGVTGLRIVRDIVTGQRDPERLAQHRDPRCRATHAEIVAALTGHYCPEQLFVLQQNVALFDECQTHIAQCDTTIDAHLQALTAPIAAPTAPLPASRSRRKTPKDNDLRFDVRTPLFHLTGGVDLTQIDGLGSHTVLKLVAEIGTDMTRWPTEDHFSSWLTLAPRNNITGGRLVSSRTPPSANRAAAILRMAAMTLGRSRTALGAFYRRMAARKDKAQANTATARKLAILVYRALKGELVYRDPGAAAYDTQQRSRLLHQLRQRATTLGFELVNRTTGEVLAAGVS
jgi:transposase